jgi:hypothetical protein
MLHLTQPHRYQCSSLHLLLQTYLHKSITTLANNSTDTYHEPEHHDVSIPLPKVWGVQSPYTSTLLPDYVLPCHLPTFHVQALDRMQGIRQWALRCLHCEDHLQAGSHSMGTRAGLGVEAKEGASPRHQQTLETVETKPSIAMNALPSLSQKVYERRAPCLDAQTTGDLLNRATSELTSLLGTSLVVTCLSSASISSTSWLRTSYSLHGFCRAHPSPYRSQRAALSRRSLFHIDGKCSHGLVVLHFTLVQCVSCGHTITLHGLVGVIQRLHINADYHHFSDPTM